ncbi:hypothetical protein BCR43DRAFT_487555 [Syncephalastrum racemosum]|uniref:Uncharacterized protein n=1 Tax=Syncephalastrum racemosum TaxID=13706 RepID=A0A1X2HHA7_SYNRA|nr:hypothetical protein BCR43DRAFT_487555 [Syncephalastrum racemosum]
MHACFLCGGKPSLYEFCVYGVVYMDCVMGFLSVVCVCGIRSIYNVSFFFFFSLFSSFSLPSFLCH